MTAVDQEEPYDFLFKIVLIGDAGVGKTCIVQRFKSGTFIERHGSTIGVDFTMKTIHLDGHRVKVCYQVNSPLKKHESYANQTELFLFLAQML